jgi:hypothetical protein
LRRTPSVFAGWNLEKGVRERSDDVIVDDIVPLSQLGSSKCKLRPTVMKGVGFTVLSAVASVVCGAGKNVLMIAVRIRHSLFMSSDAAEHAFQQRFDQTLEHSVSHVSTASGRLWC